MISVIIPNYNNSKYLKKCIESVLNQNYKDYELIIVDDGSTDDSVDIIKKYTKHKNVIFYKQNNLNASIARNRGIELSHGEYLFFLDSDDYLHSNDVFTNMVRDIKNNDLLIGNYTCIDENDNVIDRYEINNDKNIVDINNCYKYSLISPVPSNKLYKRSIIEKHNIFFSNVRIGQDLNFYLKYLAFCNKIAIVDYDIYNYRIVNTGMTKTIGYNVFDIVKCFDEIKKFYDKNDNIDDYDKYISLVQLKHYEFQIGKYHLIKSKDFRKSLLLFYKYFYKKINTSKIYDKDKFNIINKKVRKKLMFYPILSNNFSYWAVNYRRKLKNRRKNNEK